MRSLARRFELRPTKARGQNFVVDANTIRRIVAAADIGSDDIVLEIGPGLGSLTLGLLSVSSRVVAVEVDGVLAAALPHTVAEFAPGQSDRVAVVTADALTVADLPGPPATVLVANLPYNIAVPVLLHLLQTQPSIERGLVMVQLEVAERLTAAPGSRTYGVPSVKLAWFAAARRAGVVSRSVFWPVPNVDSGLVAFERRTPPPSTAGRERVFAIVDSAFGQRRKMVRTALTSLASREAVEVALAVAGVDPTSRGERLDVLAFARIADALARSAPDPSS